MVFVSGDCIGRGDILDDLRAIRSSVTKIEGAIIGKALYDGKLDYQAAVAALSYTH